MLEVHGIRRPAAIISLPAERRYVFLQTCVVRTEGVGGADDRWAIDRCRGDLRHANFRDQLIYASSAARMLSEADLASDRLAAVWSRVQAALVADNKMTKTIGEHWVCSELARSGWAPALTRDGLERTDVLAVGTHLGDRPTIEIQVKTANQRARLTNWPLGEKAQRTALSEREWFVLVLVPNSRAEPVRGFVVPRDHVAAAAWIVHQNWLTDPGATPGTRNAPVSAARVDAVVFERYEGRWDLLDQPTTTVPVLLPVVLRERAAQPRVGLPPAHPWRGGVPTNWD